MRPPSAVLLFIGVAACKPEQQQPPATMNEPTTRDTAATHSLPSDVSYTILSDEAMPPHKRSLDVLLNKKVSEEILTMIAHDLRGRDARTFERTFIVYYVPGMEVGAGGWATTHFNPDLKVAILGTTQDQEKTLTSERPAPGRDVVGTWLDDRPFMASRLTIYRSEGQLILEQKYPDGSSGESELHERATSAGRRFEEVGRQTGDYFLLDARGDLQIRDAEGLIATARKVN
jgi:hypothetical protein